MADVAYRISKPDISIESMDYQHLLRIGIRSCQKLAGDTWTDYNEHDPGITILEQLCYVLTDLGYRTHFSIEDVLIEGQESRRDALFPGDRVLTSNPLTINDYRKLISDRISGVANVWLEPVEPHPQGIRGLYRVFLELADAGTDRMAREQEDRVRGAVRDLMSAHRNLGEDTEEIVILQPVGITVRATIVASEDANPTDVLAAVLIRVQEELVPDPESRSVDEAVGRNIPLDEVFQGPRLDYGTVDDASLKPLTTEISVARVRNSILGVPGVRQVKGLQIDGAENGKLRLEQHKDRKGRKDRRGPWVPDAVPYLSPSISVPLPPGQEYLVKIETEGGSAFKVDKKRLWSVLQAANAERADSTAYDYLRLEHSAHLRLPVGTPKNLENYYSLQHHFPTAYGIGRFGVAEDFGATAGDEAGEFGASRRPDSHSEPTVRRQRRLAQARQLKAYLLIFEQLLGNFLAQLAHAPDLFSLDPELDKTYFPLPIIHFPPRDSDPPNAIELFLNPRNKGAAADTTRYSVCIVDDQPSADGGNALEILLRSHELASEAECDTVIREMLAAGCDRANYHREVLSPGDLRLLLLNGDREIIAYGEERFVSAGRVEEAIDYLAGFIAGLERRPDRRARNIIRITPKQSFGMRIVDEKGRVLLSSHNLPDEESRERRIAITLKNGIRAVNYRIVQHLDGDWSVHLRDPVSEETIALGERRFGSDIQAENEREELVERLRNLRANAPGPTTFIQRFPDSPLGVYQRVVEEYEKNLTEIVRESETVFLHRRNRFLDHLLARFNEAFDNDSLERLDPRPYEDKADFYRDLVYWKTVFLQQYVADANGHGGLSGGRARGFDDSTVPIQEAEGGVGESCANPDAHWDRRSGLERRLYLLLGMQGHVRGGRHRRFVLSKRPLVQGQPTLADMDQDTGDSAAAELFEGEGLYVLEHILLRPPFSARSSPPAGDAVRELADGQAGGHHRRGAASEPMRAAVGKTGYGEVDDENGRGVAPESVEEPVDEFFSFRISVFLPAWPVRFQPQGFKCFTENVIRENCPAHIAFRCFWLDRKAMYCFETLYREWESLKLEGSGETEELDKLAKALRSFVDWQSAARPSEPQAERVQGLLRDVENRVRRIERKYARGSHRR